MTTDPLDHHKGLNNRIYLGDGLYAGTDGYQVVLYAHNGLRVLHEVYLDALVLESFELWVKGLREGGDIE